MGNDESVVRETDTNIPTAKCVFPVIILFFLYIYYERKCDMEKFLHRLPIYKK